LSLALNGGRAAKSLTALLMGCAMPDDRDDRVSNLDDKVYEEHSERVSAAGGTPMRSGTRHGFPLDVKGKSERELFFSICCIFGDNPYEVTEEIRQEDDDGEEWLRERGIIE
jgi:hypothetical protein